MTKYDIGQTIYGLRKLRKKTQSQLAVEVKVAQEHISKIEKNKRKPTIDTLEKILIALEVKSFTQFFKLAEDVANTQAGELLSIFANTERLLETILKMPLKGYHDDSCEDAR